MPKQGERAKRLTAIMEKARKLLRRRVEPLEGNQLTREQKLWIAVVAQAIRDLLKFSDRELDERSDQREIVRWFMGSECDTVAHLLRMDGDELRRIGRDALAAYHDESDRADVAHAARRLGQRLLGLAPFELVE